MGLIVPHSPAFTAPAGRRFSARFRALSAIAMIAGFFCVVPKWAIFAPGAALIFINNSSEKLGAL